MPHKHFHVAHQYPIYNIVNIWCTGSYCGVMAHNVMYGLIMWYMGSPTSRFISSVTLFRVVLRSG